MDDASRHLNPFKLEDLDVGEKMMKQGDLQTSDDLDSGYCHLKMHEDHRKYVGCHLFWILEKLFIGSGMFYF